MAKDFSESAVNESGRNTEPGGATRCDFISKLWEMPFLVKFLHPFAGRTALSQSLEATDMSCHRKELFVGQRAF